MAPLPPPDPHLTDGRIAVRPPLERDLPAITAACQDPAIARYTMVPSPYTDDDSRFFLQMSRDGFQAGSAAHMVVVCPAGGELLGSCGIARYSAADRVAEIGYWIAKSARGKGVATAATRLVARYAFDVVGAERVTIEAATENTASNKVALAVGATLEGTLRSAASAAHDGSRGGERFDMNVYGLLPGELR